MSTLKNSLVSAGFVGAMLVSAIPAIAAQPEQHIQAQSSVHAITQTDYMYQGKHYTYHYNGHYYNHREKRNGGWHYY